MNSCCSDFSPERGCAHWGPEQPNPDPDYQGRRDETEVEERYRRGYRR